MTKDNSSRTALTLVSIISLMIGAVGGFFVGRHYSNETTDQEVTPSGKKTGSYDEAVAILGKTVDVELNALTQSMDSKIALLKPEFRLESERNWKAVRSTPDDMLLEWQDKHFIEIIASPVGNWVNAKRKQILLKDESVQTILKWGWDRVANRDEKGVDLLALWTTNLLTMGTYEKHESYKDSLAGKPQKPLEVYRRQFYLQFKQCLLGTAKPSQNDKEAYQHIFGASARFPQHW
jgi:hypothetical protein